MYNFESIPQRHRLFVSVSFKDQSNSPPLLSVAAHGVGQKGKILEYIHCMSGRELAMSVVVLDSASTEPVAAVVHAGEAGLLVVLQAGD